MSAPVGISIREFARRDGCSDKLVRRALQRGHLQALADGSIDLSLVGTGWRKLNRRAALTADKGADIGADTGADMPPDVRTQVSAPAPASAPRPARRTLPEDGTGAQAHTEEGVLSLTQAESLKENYLARLRQLEYDTKSGAVVPVDQVAALVGIEYARARTRLLAIPAEQAPRLAHLKTIPEIQDALMSVIVEALEELTRDGAATAG
jgi:hypothetical protein